MKRNLFGYSVKDVKQRIADYETLIELQRKDIEYLKRDNNLLKSTITRLTGDADNEDKL